MGAYPIQPDSASLLGMSQITGLTSDNSPLAPRLIKPSSGGEGGLLAVVATDSDGNPTGASAPSTHVGSSALEKSHVISTAACRMRSVKAMNSGGADLWLHVFDAAALPSNGTAPDRTPIPVPAGDVNGDTWEGGTALASGCVAALSSTLATLTLVGSNVGWFDAEIVS